MEGDRGQEPGRAGGGRGREAGSTRGKEAGAEIKKAIVYCLLLGIIQSNTLTWQSLKFPFNITSA